METEHQTTDLEAHSATCAVDGSCTSCSSCENGLCPGNAAFRAYATRPAVKRTGPLQKLAHPFGQA